MAPQPVEITQNGLGNGAPSARLEGRDSACVAKGLNPCRDRFAVFVAHRRAGARYSYFAQHMRRPRGKHEDAIGESNRLVDVVGDEHGDHTTALDEPRQIALQLPSERRVERNEGLVEQQQGRANGERARQRGAPRQADRKFARKMRPVIGEAERGEAATSASLALGAARRTLSSTLRHGRSRGS
jgi:hypothetical protein